MSPDTARLAVCPFTLVIDCREQIPYDFRRIPTRANQPTLAVPTITKRLDAGDYSIESLEDQIAIERKSLPDLYSTLGQQRERFAREFERLQELAYAAVVVEADWRAICNPARFVPGWHSRLNPRAVWATIFSWSQRYPGVHWFTMGSRRLAEIATFEILERFWRRREYCAWCGKAHAGGPESCRQ